MLKRRSLRIVLYILAGFLALCAALLIFSRTIVALVAEDYLARRGASVTVDVIRLDSSGATLKLVAGPGEAPDASADIVEITFGPGRYGRRVEAVTLTGAYMHIRFDGKRVAFGSLTDFIDKMMKEPAVESDFVAKNLPVILKSMRVRLTTQAGVVDLAGKGAIRGGTIEHLNLGAAGGRIGFYGYGYGYRADVRRIALEISGGKGLYITGMLDAGVSGDVNIASLNASFATDLVAVGSKIGLPNLRLVGDVRMSQAEAAKLASAIPYWSGDAENHSALKRALTDFGIDVPGLMLDFDGERSEIRLKEPAYADSASGAELKLEGAIATQGGKGRADISAMLRHGGFASTHVILKDANWRDARGVMEGRALFDARFTAQMLRDAKAKGAARFVIEPDRMRIGLEDCAEVAMAGLRPGTRLAARAITGKLCALGEQPVYAMDAKGWRARARWTNGAGHIVAANARLSQSSGEAVVDGQGDPKTGVVTIDAARLDDAAKSRRFGALKAKGQVTLANGIWRGDMDVTARRGSRLGNVTFSHVLSSGAGEARIDARNVKFTEKGLQPVDLSPFLVNVAKAEGLAHFSGTIGWRGSKITSRGELVVDKSKFATPLGTAHGGNVRIKFSSLVPLVAAPGQEAEVEKIDWVSALTENFAKFGFTQEKFTLQAAGTSAAKGTVKLDPLTVYFSSKEGIEGRLVLEHVDLGQLLADSNLGQDVKIEARISGSVPFQFDDKGFRIRDGRIAADGPGRLTIRRQLWLGSRTTVPNAVEDFAYQALENLAFDSLEGTLNSLPGGRMQLVLRIIGANDPAIAQEARIDVLSLIKGEAFQTPMPLPSGTPIDLTLDTNLNFDEVLRAYQDAWAETKAENRERISK